MASSIDMESIIAKAKACMATSGKQREVSDKYDRIFEGKDVASSGSFHTPYEAGQKFADVLYDTMTDKLGYDVANSIGPISSSMPFKRPDGRWQVPVYFVEDLHRDSLYEKGYPNGIDNIAALLNAGATMGDHVYGYWHGNFTISRTQIPHSNFVQKAIDDFLGNYGNEYNVWDIEIANDDFTISN